MGLAVVYAIAKRRGGFWEVQSEVGSGSTFTLFLPLLQQAAPVDIDEVKPRVEKSKSVGTILVAEDEPSVRRLVEHILRADGHEIIVAASGEEALAQFHSHNDSIGLLLTDVVMPGMGGLELAKRLRVLSPTLAILFMSGYTEDTVRDDMGSLKAGFLAKPFSRVELSDMVQKAYALRLS